MVVLLKREKKVEKEEIEVTDEMLEAGQALLSDWQNPRSDTDYGSEEGPLTYTAAFLQTLYRAMAALDRSR